MRTFFDDNSDSYKLASNADLAHLIWEASCKFEKEHYSHDPQPIKADSFYGISHRIYKEQNLSAPESIFKHFMVLYFHDDGTNINLGFDNGKLTYYRNSKQSIYDPKKKFKTKHDELIRELNSYFQARQDISSLVINETNFSRICYENRGDEIVDFYRAHALAPMNYFFEDASGISYELGFGFDVKSKKLRYFNVGYPENEIKTIHQESADKIEFFYDARRKINGRLDYEFYWYNLKREKDLLREVLLKYF